MSLAIVSSFTLAEINLAVPLIAPLLAQFDLALTGSFGLGPLEADLSAQFNAALSASVSLGLQISNPLEGFQLALQGIANLSAELTALIALGVPTVSAELNAGLSAQLAITALIAAKLGGIQALIELALSVKLPVVQLLASLGVGPVFVLRIDQTGGPFTLDDAGLALQSDFAAGLVDPLNPLVQILPTDPVYGVVLITKSPSAFAALQLMLKAS